MRSIIRYMSLAAAAQSAIAVHLDVTNTGGHPWLVYMPSRSRTDHFLQIRLKAQQKQLHTE